MDSSMMWFLIIFYYSSLQDSFYSMAPPLVTWYLELLKRLQKVRAMDFCLYLLFFMVSAVLGADRFSLPSSNFERWTLLLRVEMVLQLAIFNLLSLLNSLNMILLIIPSYSSIWFCIFSASFSLFSCNLICVRGQILRYPPQAYSSFSSLCLGFISEISDCAFSHCSRSLSCRLRMLMVSMMRDLLMLRSRGESVTRLGWWLIYRRMGSPVSRRRMSKPSSQKQTDYYPLSLLYCRCGSSLQLMNQRMFLKFMLLSLALRQDCSILVQAARIDLRIIESILSLIFPVSQPSDSRVFMAEVRERLCPLLSSLKSRFPTKLGANLLIAQLVRCIFSFLKLVSLGCEYLEVASLHNPYSQTNTLRGSRLLTRTQTRRSNLQPSINMGFSMYYWTMTSSLQVREGFLLRQIPLPWQLACGLTIQKALDSLWVKAQKSLGSTQVLGQN